MIAGLENVDVSTINNHDSWLPEVFYNKRPMPICSTTSASKKLNQIDDISMTAGSLQGKDDIFFEHQKQ